MDDPLAALAEPNRRRILHLLGRGELTVTELASQFGVTRSAISQHLGVLARAGLVTARRDGRFQYYRVEPSGMQRLHDSIDAFWTVELDELAAAVPPSTKEVVMSCEKSVVVPLDADQTFLLLTEPERLRRWSAVCTRMELHAGGDYRWTLNPGHTAAGTFTEVEPGRRLVYSFGWEGDDALPPGSSTVTVTLEPVDDGTLVRLIHDGLDEEQAVGHLKGWEHFLNRLVDVAKTGDAGPDEWNTVAPTDPLTSAESSLVACQDALRDLTPEMRTSLTPCSEYTVDQLTDHLMESLTHLSAMAGVTVADQGSAVSPECRVADAAQQCLEAWRNRGLDGTVDIGGMELPAEVAAAIISVELLVHGWDFATAVGRSFDVSPELADYVHDRAVVIGVPQMRASGRFGPEVDAGPDAGSVEKLMAFTGRTV